MKDKLTEVFHLNISNMSGKQWQLIYKTGKKSIIRHTSAQFAILTTDFRAYPLSDINCNKFNRKKNQNC